MAYLVLAAPAPGALRGCRTRRMHIKVTKRLIAETERAEAEGHQPWRSDAKFVADFGLMKAEIGLDPNQAHLIRAERKIISPTREVYRYNVQDRGRTDRVTVRRFHWRDPASHQKRLTVWWVTEIAVTDCSERVGK
ncbi:MAG: hypothetical protein ACLQOO_22315 [Terriglobia bacterium]